MGANGSNEASTRCDEVVAVCSQQKVGAEGLGMTMMASRFAAGARTNRV